MNNIFRTWFNIFKAKILDRLDPRQQPSHAGPAFSAQNIDYDVSSRTHAIGQGGIGLIHLLVQELDLPEAINEQVRLFKYPTVYHESDHVLNIAYNAMCNGTCLQDIELRRNNLAFLDALGAERIPDPTTAGDFCRRFTAADIRNLHHAIDTARRKVWEKQPKKFFKQATIDMDGTLIATDGECKAGMDLAYDGTWGYHPLVLSMAETGEVLRVINRPGNRPSHEGAAEQVDECIWQCHQAGFENILLRGDTDFSQTQHLDRWDGVGNVQFIFGYNAMEALKQRAGSLPESAWQALERPPGYTVRTQPRQRPANVKDAKVREREFDILRLQSEEVAEFEYRPGACRKSYRMVVVRKHISREKGERVFWPEIRYFFYITNDRQRTAAEVVFAANDRCNQENLLAQLHEGVRALKAPVNTLESNGAWMVMSSLAWTLKAWWALMLPEGLGVHQKPHQEAKQRVLRMEFKTFVNAFVLIPCQIIRTGRKIIYRLLGWNPHLETFFRLLTHLRS